VTDEEGRMGLPSYSAWPTPTLIRNWW